MLDKVKEVGLTDGREEAARRLTKKLTGSNRESVVQKLHLLNGPAARDLNVSNNC